MSGLATLLLGMLLATTSAEPFPAIPVPGLSAPSDGQPSAQYKMRGNKELWPASIRDDGDKVYIEWTPAQAIPAVFSLDGLGREEMVNGYMRGGVFTIDRVYDTLVFRIDKAEVIARRVLPKATGQ